MVADLADYPSPVNRRITCEVRLVLRRKTLPVGLRPAFAVFCDQADQIQATRQIVLSCLPVGRVERAPVPAGLRVLAADLEDLRPRLPEWRVEEVAGAWEACRGAVDESLAAVPAAVAVADSSGELEELLAAVADVVEPLGDAWSAAERRWLGLRRREP